MTDWLDQWVEHEEKLRKSLMGLFAYDTGGVDSGIKDESLREQCIQQLEGMDETYFRLSMSRMVREEFLSDEALVKGYGIEDVSNFIRWLSDRMNCDI